MANTISSNLIKTVVEGFNTVSRELVGFIPGVMRDPTADRVAKNQTLYSWNVGPATLSDITPGIATPAAADKTLTASPITISNFKMTDFFFTGEEEMALGSAFPGIVSMQIEEGIRAIVNQMEADIATAAMVGASRAYGTSGTTPFGTNTGESAQLKKILDDNGRLGGSRSLVIDTTAAASLRTLGQLTKVNESGTTMTLRDGELLNLNGFSVRESAAIQSVTAGTGASYLINNGAGYAVGATSLTLDTGSGTILAGDVITIGAHKYVVATALASNVVVIAQPGLRAAVADNATVTVNATGTRNIAFRQSGLLLATRLPALPSGGDIGDARELITDERSGITIELAKYKQYRQVRYELAAAWSATVINPRDLAVLLG